MVRWCPDCTTKCFDNLAHACVVCRKKQALRANVEIGSQGKWGNMLSGQIGKQTLKANVETDSQYKWGNRVSGPREKQAISTNWEIISQGK